MKKLLFILVVVGIGNLQIVAQQFWDWQNPKPQGNDLNAISFINEYEGWIVGDGWTVLHTTDGGQNWEIQTTGIWNYNSSSTSSGLRGVSFVNENHGSAVGTEVLILRTADGGNSWQTQASGTSNTLNAVAFTDENNGVIAGSAGILLFTTDGGTTWVNKPPSTSLPYLAVSLVGANFCAAITTSAIYMTSNAGESWFQSKGNTSISDIFFVSTLTGYASRGSTILKTNNGGRMMARWHPCSAKKLLFWCSTCLQPILLLTRGIDPNGFAIRFLFPGKQAPPWGSATLGLWGPPARM